MSQALYRKWRPQTWEAVVGQDHVIKTLRNAVAANKVAHAYLFAGPRGTGKTTTARLLAKAVFCQAEDRAKRPCGECEPCQAVSAGRYLDLIEIDAASNTSVEDVRDLRDKINFSPNQGKFKVYIIDEVHMLSTAAFNALLKTLEEPPPHAIFILATTEVHKIPPTVLSRCQRHEFRRIPVADIVAQLQSLAKSEGIKVEKEALDLVARQSTGAMRDAISLLDQLSSSGKKITVEMARDVLGTATSQAVLEVVAALVAEDVSGGLDRIHAALDQGSDPRQFARQVVDYLRDLLLIRMQNSTKVDASPDMRATMAQHAQAFETNELLRIIRAFNTAANEARNTWQPALPLEMAFVESLEPPAAVEAIDSQAVGAPVSQQVHSKEGKLSMVSGENRARQAHGTVKEQKGAAGQTITVEDSGPVDPVEISKQGMAASSDALFRQVIANWKKIVQVVNQVDRHTAALLNSCKPFGMKETVLFLGFTGELLKSKMESGENIAITRQALAQVLGIDMPVRCFVASGKSGSLPPDVDSEGMVAAALRDLGGEIVDIQ